MESQIFWFVATLTCVLAFGFTFKQRNATADGARSAAAGLAKGQEKDNWLTCVIVWGVILSKDAEFSRELQLLGSIVLGWTAWRTLKRVALLPRSRSG